MQAAAFAQLVVRAYKNDKGIFSKKVNAEELIPKTANDKQKALFLFYVIQLDYAVRSQNLYTGAQRLFLTNPSFFSPHYINNLPPKELEKILRKYLKPRYINEAIRRYKENSRILIKKYQGDPRKIFQWSNSAEEVLQILRNFRGFGPKIGNFFVRTMINTFNYSYPDIEDLLPPVDVHDVKIAYLLGFVNSPEMTNKNIKKVKNLWSNACKKAGVSWLIFDKALWLLGSEGQPKSKNDIFKLLDRVPFSTLQN